ncbi:MAG: ferritin [Planctomycetota bacterium]|nr:ferritin [Planctomycetota bacterium]
MNTAIGDAFCRQVRLELTSCYLYKQMASWFEGKDLPGFANWMRKQAHEEVGHALVFFSRLTAGGQRADIGTVDPPIRDFTSVQGCFSHFVDHEKSVSGHLSCILELARKHRDAKAVQVLEWFEGENGIRGEEVDRILGRLKMASGERCPLLRTLDGDLAARRFRLPASLRMGA